MLLALPCHLPLDISSQKREIASLTVGEDIVPKRKNWTTSCVTKCCALHLELN